MKWLFRSAFFLLTVISITWPLSLSACCHDRKPLEVVTITQSCLAEPPPRPEPLVLAGPDEGCPEVFTFCAGSEAAVRLESYIRKTQRWMKQTALACSDEGVPDATDSN